MKIFNAVLPLVTLLGLVACSTDADQADEVAEAAVEQDSLAGQMPGMMGMQDDPMMEQMQVWMSAMMAVGADSMAAMMPQHRQMAANMLAQMNREMREMNMTADASWTATVDSLRQDLTQLPEMSPDEMRAFMPAHHARMQRLMEMHRAMMGSMRM